MISYLKVGISVVASFAGILLAAAIDKGDIFRHTGNGEADELVAGEGSAASVGIVMGNHDTGMEVVDDVEDMLRQADSLRRVYLFQKSLTMYDRAYEAEADSLRRLEIEDAKMLSENGLGMSDFVLTPTVVARHRFSVGDFYLYYPLKDRSWRPLPNVLDTLGSHPFYRAVYFPEGERSLYFSAPDSEGSVNIYRTELKDSTWSVPALLNEYLVSSGDEIFPMFSADGKKLYFSSSGLYGMGGFDIYVSVWNEDQQEWGPPTNMGMPFSSPFNDFLYYDTPDGKYTIFASDRACPRDSVDVYVLEQETMPVRRAIDDVQELRRVMELSPVDDIDMFDTAGAVTQTDYADDKTAEYSTKVAEVRSLRDSLYRVNAAVNEIRAHLADNDDPAWRTALEAEIRKAEEVIPGLQDSLEKASAMLQEIEMKFLFQGIVLDPDKLVNEADREVQGAASNYVFVKMDPGAAPDMVIEKPVVKFDYTFMILPEGRFAQDNTIPPGIVYQIQIFSLSNPTTVESLKGLSPVFHELSPSGRHIYRVGVFRTYNDVLSNLNKVKRLGFRTAFIVAFRDGSPIQISRARSLESKTVEVPVYQISIVPPDGSLSPLAISAIEQMAGKKDIARSEKDGRITYIVGTFDDKTLVDKLVVALRATGVSEVSYTKIGTKEVEL